jgi:hypothetical protein
MLTNEMVTENLLAIRQRRVVYSHVVIASRYTRGYRPIEMLNSTAAFVSEKTWARRNRHIEVRLCRNEVYLQQLKAVRKP